MKAVRQRHLADPERFEKLAEAIKDVRENGISIWKAAEKYGVPRSTIHDRLKGKVAEGTTKMGPNPYLSADEEKKITDWCMDLSRCGFPLKVDDLLNTVQNIIKDSGRKTPFKNDRPGRTWLTGFFKRNPSVAKREAESITKGRAVITEQYIRSWFKELSDYLKEINQENVLEDPSRILNGDETSFSLCPRTGKVIAPKGFKNIYQVQSGSEKDTLTVLMVCSASGTMLPPMVIFPYLRPPKDIVQSMPKGWILGRTESGWMRSETFYEYVANCVHKWITEQNIKRPVIFFVDGHKSHLTMELSEFCSKNGIILYALPANTTHILQPADVSLFRPLKCDWKKTVRNWQSENVGEIITRKTFARLLEHTLNGNSNIENTIRNGFRKCGLYPLDPNAVDYTKCIKNYVEKVANNQENIASQNTTKYENALEVIQELSVDLKAQGIDSEKILNVIKDKIINLTALEISLNDLTPGVVFDLQSDGTLKIAEVIEDSLIPDEIQSSENLCQVAATSNVDAEPVAPNFENLRTSTPSCSPSPSSRTSSISSSLSKHLFYPKLLPFPKKLKSKAEQKQNERIPSAISSDAWREIYTQKENNKQNKIAEINKRRQERLKRKLERLNKKSKETAKSREKCNECNEELISDIEDDNLKNIGCDTCAAWYHLKCTTISYLSYEEATKTFFLCTKCDTNSIINNN